ncbi:MAG TPA: FAD-dependent oxidoreductase [Baekduia sp.]|nr:FAD-dependent oxidoreductase [Baekduia sp.]
MSAGVVIAGGGLAGQRCAEALRRGGYDGPVRIVCGEDAPPYDRPPLSKGALAGTQEAAGLRLRDDRWYAEHDVELVLGRRAAGLDPAARRVQLAGGQELPYEHLVVATGATPRSLPGLERHAGALALRDVGDALALRGRLAPGARLVVVGGGFIGLEVAATATALGAEVTVLEATGAPLSGPLGGAAGARFAALHRRRGVRLETGVRIARAIGTRTIRGVALADGRRVPADVLLVAVGAAPDTRWLAPAGLPPDGVPVDGGGRTGVPAVLAAGDAARPRDPRTGALRRSEHWDAAVRSGAAAARTILGLPEPPEVPAFFWSDQHGVRIQLVGEPHGADRTTTDGDPHSDAYATTYWRGDRPVAVLLVGRPHGLAGARRLIAGTTTHTDPERQAA